MSQSDNIENIVVRYSPPLLNFIRSQVKSHEDAEDILQDVFYQLARVNDDEEYKIDKVSSWLFHVAHNLVRNFWRKKHELSLSSLSDAEDDIFDDIAQTLACPNDEGPETTYFRKLIWEEFIIRKSKNPAKPKRKVQNPAKIGENHNSKRLLKYKSRNIGMIKKSIGSQANPMLFFAY